MIPFSHFRSILLMRTLRQFITEAKKEGISKKEIKKLAYERIKFTINSFGFETKDSSTVELIVFTNEPKRSAFLKDLAEKLKSARLTIPNTVEPIDFEYNVASKSTAGEITCWFIDDSIRILAKHFKKTEGGTVVKVNPGVENELRFMEAVRQVTGAKDAKDMTGEPVNIVFKAKEVHTAPVEIKEVINCKHSGTDTKGRKKADVVLVCKNGKEVPISIKQDNAEMWESSDSYFGEYVRDIFERLDLMAQVDYKKTVYVDPKKKSKGKSEENGYNWTLEKGSEFKFKVNDRNIVKDVSFGSDILDNGFIVQKTFTETPMELKNDSEDIRTFVCPVTFLAMTVDEIINSSHCVYVVCRNNAGRANATMGYRGLRIIVYMGDRRKNAREIDVDKLPPLSKLKRELVRYMSEEAKEAEADVNENKAEEVVE